MESSTFDRIQPFFLITIFNSACKTCLSCFTTLNSVTVNISTNEYSRFKASDLHTTLCWSFFRAHNRCVSFGTRIAKITAAKVWPLKKETKVNPRFLNENK